MNKESKFGTTANEVLERVLEPIPESVINEGAGHVTSIRKYTTDSREVMEVYRQYLLNGE